MTRTSIGFVGPARGAEPQLERALTLLAGDPGMRQIVYLGVDDALDQVSERWGARIDEYQSRVLERAVQLAPEGTAEAIDALLAEPDPGRQATLLRKLPESPKRAVELLDRYVVLAVHDKAVLDEDDIANAHAIAYGRADEPQCKRFGLRGFLTPGPLTHGTVARVSLHPDGALELSLLRLDGTLLVSEPLRDHGNRVVVTP
jgi:hypothetical protein